MNAPVYRASTLLFSSVKDLEAALGSPRSYGRNGTPGTRALESALCELEGGFGAMLTPSGLSAVTTSLLSCVKPGGHLLVVDSVYGPTRNFCNGTLRRLGVEISYFDPVIGADIAALIRPETTAIFTESPGSNTFEVQDIPAICHVAHERGIRVLLDNTWGTPIHFASFKHGVDIAIHAATKYIAGHSDLLLGAILCNEASYAQVRGVHKELGLTVSGDDAFLALRGLRTLTTRLARHQESALAVARWLMEQDEVDRVLYPALPGDPGHSLWSRDFTGACGLFGVQLKPVGREALARMLDGMRLFGMGFSWGGFESLILPVEPGHYRTARPWPSGGPLLRLHVGLEGVHDLISDLRAGLDRLSLT